MAISFCRVFGVVSLVKDRGNEGFEGQPFEPVFNVEPVQRTLENQFFLY